MSLQISDFTECRDSGQLYYNLDAGFQLWISGKSDNEDAHLCRFQCEPIRLAGGANMIEIMAIASHVDEAISSFCASGLIAADNFPFWLYCLEMIDTHVYLDVYSKIDAFNLVLVKGMLCSARELSYELNARGELMRFYDDMAIQYQNCKDSNAKLAS